MSRVSNRPSRLPGPHHEPIRPPRACLGANSGSSALADQQRWLYQAITKPGPSDPWVERRVRGGTLTPARRVDIYRRGYVQRLLECLRDDFPGVEMALGVEAFEGYCREYSARHPPQSVSLNGYGERFPDFLRAMTADARGGVPDWVAELAVLEWATVRAIHADATETLRRADFGRVPSDGWGELQLRLSPSVHSFEFGHAINGYLTDARRARGAGIRLEPPLARTSWVLVCRNTQDVWRLDLAGWAYRLLEALRRGRTLAEALGEVGASEAVVAAGAVTRCFQEWVACGVFSEFTIARP